MLSAAAGGGWPAAVIRCVIAVARAAATIAVLLLLYLPRILAGQVRQWVWPARRPPRRAERGRRRVVLLSNRVGVYIGHTGGGSLMRASLVRDLQRAGVEVIVLGAGGTPRGEGGMTWDDTTLRGPLLRLSPTNLARLWRHVSDAELVIVSGSTSAWMPTACFLAACQGVPSMAVLTQNSVDAELDEGFADPVRRRLFMMWYLACDLATSRVAVRCLTRSAAYRAKIERRGVRCDGVAVLPSQYEIFRQHDDDAVVRHARDQLTAGAPPGSPVLLYAGRLVVDKRIDLLVRSRPHGCVLAVVGTGRKGDPGVATIAALHDPPRGVVVRRCGAAQDELRVLYKAADAVVSASDGETFGNTCHEALLCGTPVVLQRAGGYLGQVGEGQGELVDWEQPDEVAAAVTRVLSSGLKGRATPIDRPDAYDAAEVALGLLLPPALTTATTSRSGGGGGGAPPGARAALPQLPRIVAAMALHAVFEASAGVAPRAPAAANGATNGHRRGPSAAPPAAAAVLR